MIKNITFLSFLLIGVASMAQSVTHAEELKKEALNYTTAIVKADRDGDASVTTEEKKIGSKTVKVTKKDGEIVRVGLMEEEGDRLHVLLFIYKNDKLILATYSSADKKTNKKISNYRYYNTKGKCESSVLQDGINGDNSVKEETGNTKDAKTRKSEAENFMKLAKAGDLDKFKNVSVKKF